MGPATVTGVEDLVLRRLASVKHWGGPTDFEQAFLLLRSQGDRVDWGYLEGKAKQDGTADLLTRLRAALDQR
jgi:hypothetical protein